MSVCCFAAPAHRNSSLIMVGVGAVSQATCKVVEISAFPLPGPDDIGMQAGCDRHVRLCSVLDRSFCLPICWRFAPRVLRERVCDSLRFVRERCCSARIACCVSVFSAWLPAPTRLIHAPLAHSWLPGGSNPCDPATFGFFFGAHSEFVCFTCWLMPVPFSLQTALPGIAGGRGPRSARGGLLAGVRPARFRGLPVLLAECGRRDAARCKSALHLCLTRSLSEYCSLRAMRCVWCGWLPSLRHAPPASLRAMSRVE